jgi:hypothetical protein
MNGGTAANLQDRTPPLDAPLPDVWTAFEADFVVEWQVPDGSTFGGPSGGGELNSL